MMQALHLKLKPLPRSGMGYRCGFLGLLHLEIIQERLSREFDLNLITTSPSVVYKIEKTNGEVEDIHNPSQMPDVVKINKIFEPIIKATILLPDEYLGPLFSYVQKEEVTKKDLTYVGKRAMVVYDLPLAEVVLIFMIGLNRLPVDTLALITNLKNTLRMIL